MGRSGKGALLRVDGDRLWQHAKALCEGIGPRLSGTPGGARAAEYIARHFRQCGAQVEVQEYPCPAWEHEATELLLVSLGGAEPLPVYAQTFTQACDVEAELVGVTREEDLEFSPDLEGKALLLHGKLATGLALDRNSRVLSIEDRRPAAVVAVSPGETVSTKLLRDPFLRVPAAAVPAWVGEKLLAHEGARVRLSIRARRYASTGHNVIGRLGSAGEGQLMVAAHFDTAAGSPGATDNASGTAAVLELCEAFAAAGRTGIDFVAYDAEEYGRHGGAAGGNLGSVEYVRRHPVEARTARGVVEADCIGTAALPPRARAMGWPGAQRVGIQEALQPFSRLALDVRLEGETPRTAFHLPGVPALAFVNDFGKLPIHTAQDTIDLMSAETLAYNVDAIAAAVNSLSSGREA